LFPKTQRHFILSFGETPINMISIGSAGGYDKLEYKALKDGCFTEGANVNLSNIPEEDLVVVKTFACGVNYADVCIRWGLYDSAKKFVGWPITPGFEFSGEIVSKGSNVHEFEVGQHVFGVSLFGGYSHRIRVPQQQLFPLPDKLDKYQAAGFPAVALTAWYALFELARPRPGSWVLVHSAAGGVGSTLVQLAKIAGCQVVGVVGATHKVELVKQLGEKIRNLHGFEKCCLLIPHFYLDICELITEIMWNTAPLSRRINVRSIAKIFMTSNNYH
jgi:threonine dehydrogenase-like Zn-dependent dehydrogenase